METESFVLQLNEAARQCPNLMTKKQLRDCAADLKAACVAIGAACTLENGKRVSSLFARGWRLLCIAQATTPGGNGARMKEAKAA
jgi:hypothetical protein